MFNNYLKLFIFVLILVVINGKRWTEEDERKRIAKIKAEERQKFRLEMGGSLDGGKLYDDDISGYGGRSDYSSEFYPTYRDFQSPNSYYRPKKQQTPISQALKSEESKPISLPSFAKTRSIIKNGNETLIEPIHWCFTCTSPLRILSGPMQQAIHNLLDVRRTDLPKNVISDCHQPANIKTLPKQECKHSYCQTLVLTEHERGIAFAMRGCAESFAAINEAVLNARDDNDCVKIHPNIDLKECICKNRKYCYKGSRNDKIEAASEQVVMFPAKLSSNSISSFYINIPMLILSLLCHLIQ